MGDPRESSSYSVTPRIRYNTIGGINGPLVILENVSVEDDGYGDIRACSNKFAGQIPKIQ